MESIDLFKKNLTIFLTTILMSTQEKNSILTQAITLSKATLMNKGLTIPFKVNLAGYNFKKDSSIWTLAKYHGSSMNGVINISIKSHMLSNKVNFIIHNILHEYSHDIYREGLYHPYLFSEILNLEKYYSCIFNYDSSQLEVTLNDVMIKEELFCDFFPLYLNENLNEYFNKYDIKEIENICRKITKEYHINRNIITPEHPPDASDFNPASS